VFSYFTHKSKENCEYEKKKFVERYIIIMFHLCNYVYIFCLIVRYFVTVC